MARNFNGTSDSFSIADNAALTVASVMSESFWIRCDAMADATAHYISNWGNNSASPSLYVSIYGDSHASAGAIRFRYENSAGQAAAVDFNDKITDSGWHHVVLAKSGSYYRGWLDGVLQTDTGADYLTSMNVAGDRYFGGMNGSSGFFAGDMAEWAKWDAELSTEQITALAGGVRPTEIGTWPAWYLPMLAGLDEEIAGLTVTNAGTTVAEHPPAIIRPGIPHILRTIWLGIGGPYQVSAAATAASGTADGQIFSAGTTIGQINGY